MLRWNTVNELLKDSLVLLMKADELLNFRLVGGTALSLQLGHRKSVDIDLFTDAEYGSVDFNSIEDFLKRNFSYIEGDFGTFPGMGKSYLIGSSHDHVIKLDVYYSMDPFFQDFYIEEGIRMATLEEITAMKVDIIQRVGRKKDFWDLHEVLDQYTIQDMIDLHKQRFQWTHNQALIEMNFLNFSKADHDFDPICLKGKEWVFIKDDFEAAIKEYKGI